MATHDMVYKVKKKPYGNKNCTYNVNHYRQALFMEVYCHNYLLIMQVFDLCLYFREVVHFRAEFVYNVLRSIIKFSVLP